MLLPALVLLAGCDGPSSSSEEPSPTVSERSPEAPSASASEPSPSASDSSRPPKQSALPPYRSSIERIDAELARRMEPSHDGSCPVALEALRYLRMSFVDFDGTARLGEMVVHADVARDVVAVFAELYAQRFPIRRMRLVDEYDGDDDRSMAADNTSAYNCRRVAGTDRWSEHAYGRAIDVNPVQNPYVRDGSVAPPSGRPFADVDRSPGASPPPGVVHAGSPVVRAFRAIGWSWGGSWTSSKDYQHFSLSGR